jgi:hypothetical protein
MATDLRSIDEIALYPVKPFTRRTFLGIGSAFIAAVAALSTPEAASADCQSSPCCCLASCTKCSLNACGGWSCPSGYTAQCWNCTSGGRWYVCGECTNGSNCYNGSSYNCSIWFGESSPGCPLGNQCP